MDPERLVANIHRAYAELDGAGRGADIDLVATRHDMIAFNGGGPLRCFA
jgi:cyclase